MPSLFSATQPRLPLPRPTQIWAAFAEIPLGPQGSPRPTPASKFKALLWEFAVLPKSQVSSPHGKKKNSGKGLAMPGVKVGTFFFCPDSGLPLQGGQAGKGWLSPPPSHRSVWGQLAKGTGGFFCPFCSFASLQYVGLPERRKPPLRRAGAWEAGSQGEKNKKGGQDKQPRKKRRKGLHCRKQGLRSQSRPWLILAKMGRVCRAGDSDPSWAGWQRRAREGGRPIASQGSRGFRRGQATPACKP